METSTDFNVGWRRRLTSDDVATSETALVHAKDRGSGRGGRMETSDGAKKQMCWMETSDGDVDVL